MEGPLRLRRILASARALAAAAVVAPGAATGGPNASPLASTQRQLAAALAEADGPPAAGGPNPAVTPGPTLDLNAIPPPFARPAAPAAAQPAAAHAGSRTAAPEGLAEGRIAGAVPAGRAELPDERGAAQPTAMHVDNEQDDDEEVCSGAGCPCCRAFTSAVLGCSSS